MLLRIMLLLIFLSLNYHTSPAQVPTQKVSVLWVDPLKNLEKITTRRGILAILDQAKNAGFQAIALGVKTNNGYVLYDSKVAPRLLEWDSKRVPLDFDIIRVFVEEGRSRQLQVYALFPVLAEGDMLLRTGTLYRERPDWQTTVYVVENETPQIIPITQWAYGPVAFANPLNQEVEAYEISILKEFLQEYSVDGLLLDKLRFSGIESDFSDNTRIRFEQFLAGRKVDWWPEDIFEWQQVNNRWEPIAGQLFNQWLEFRAKVIQNLVNKLVSEIRTIDPSLPIGNFVGAWYPTYYEYGVNWASEGNIPRDEWATNNYNQTAIAEKVDYSVVGCFFPRLTIQDAETGGAEWWMSVEGGATLAMDLVNKSTPVYGAILAGQFKDREIFRESIRMALNLTNGLYVTDVSHLDDLSLWDEIRAILKGENVIKARTAK